MLQKLWSSFLKYNITKEKCESGFVNPAVILPYDTSAVLEWAWDLQSGRITVYFEKPSSITTHCNAQNQVFLVIHVHVHCNHL